MAGPKAVAFAQEVVAGARPKSAQRAKALLFAASRLGDFALSAGLELSAEVVLRPEVIERFVICGCGGRSAPTRRTLRTNLRALSRALEAYPAPRPVALPREQAKKPYTQRDISAYLALADAQPTRSRAMRAGALICLGAGAGLVGADLAGVRGTDVLERSGGVVVDVAGAHPRAVPVLARFGERLADSATFAGEGFVVGGTERSRHNVSSQLISSLSGGASLPRLQVARLRATWLAEVAGAIGLGAFMAAAGVDVSQRLGDIAAGLAKLAEHEMVAILGGARC
jgi:integrase